MATSLSLFLMPTDNEKQEPPTLTLSAKPAEPSKATAATTTRTKKPANNKCQARKKKPQRGMGVEQLERLRIQERWKAITEANQIGSLNLQPAQQLHVFDPFNSNNQMLHYGTPVNYAVPMSSNGRVLNGSLGWDQQGGVVVKRVDGNCGFNVTNNGGFGSGQVFVNPYMVGSVPVHHVGVPATTAVFEASKGLSSIPKVTQQQKQYEPSRCDLCFKMGGFSTRAAKSAFYANHGHNHNNNGGLEVKAVHRKESSPMGRKVIMEYEFFPGTNGKSTCFKEMEFPAAEASVAEGTNPVDLSLKLSV